MREWSAYQEAVFDFVKNGSGNCLVEAKPGSGKTTVIEECIRRIPPNENVLALAFNRHIKEELEKRMASLPNVSVYTLNGFGNQTTESKGQPQQGAKHPQV